MFNIVKILIDPLTNERLDPVKDFFFKKLFGEEGSKKLVLYLIKSVLEDPLTQKKTTTNATNINKEVDKVNIPYIDCENFNFINPSMNADTVEKKGSIVDVLAETPDLTLHIEAQIQDQTFFGKRLTFYIMRIVSKNLNKGNDYTELNNIISIAILGHEINEIPNYHIIADFDSCESPEILFKNEIKCHIIQVPKLKKSKYDLNNKLHRLLIFLDKDSPEQLFKKVIEMDEVIKEAYNVLDHTIKDEKEMDKYNMSLIAEMDYKVDMRESKKKGIEEGIEKGRKEGREEAMIIVAKKMKEIERPVEEIAKLTNMSKEKIMNL
jgi:predicted transposase/invertase (TIGR01784 family)